MSHIVPVKRSVAEILAAARAAVAAKEAEKKQKEAARAIEVAVAVNMQTAEALTVHAPTIPLPHPLNPEQQMAVDYAYFGRSFNLIGSAGVGKTYTVKAIIKTLQAGHRFPILDRSTQRLTSGTPGVAMIAYTRRAVRQMAKQMDEDMRKHCMTFHALVEYAPEEYQAEVWNSETQQAEWVTKMRFAPTYHAGNKLPAGLKYIFIDESSMLSTEYFQQLWDALPRPEECVFIFIGDLNQLPPVYGIPILGKKLTELPIIELTRVYRQALESPIIALALAVKNNDFTQFERAIKAGEFSYESERDVRILDLKSMPKSKTVIEREGKGKVTLHVWKKPLEKEDGLAAVCAHLRGMIIRKEYDPDEDIVLCPWDKSFGAIEMNLAIADFLGRQRGAKVWEVIAGYEKKYLAVGDRLMIDKAEAIIEKIEINPKYLGKTPVPASEKMNRWGVGGEVTGSNFFDEDLSEDQIQAMLDAHSDVKDRSRSASHLLTVKWLDTGYTTVVSEAGAINSSQFAYAMTVHKSQGSEYRRVIVVTSHVHGGMCSRELVYTAFTRASQELYVLMAPGLLRKAAAAPRIKGDTLADKIAFFKSRLEEKEMEVVDDKD